MSKGTILTCGYYSLNGVYSKLRDLGYTIVKIRELKNPELDEYCVDESKKYAEITKEGTEKEYEVGHKTLQELTMYTLGGIPLMRSRLFSVLLANRAINASLVTDITEEHFDYLCKKYNISGVLVHSSKGPKWGVILKMSKKLGIPTFCCYNGTLVQYFPKLGASSFYNNAGYYYLHGEYDYNWIMSKDVEYTANRMPIVGQPAFDCYYNNNKDTNKQCNTFLYGGSLITNECVIEENLVLSLYNSDCSRNYHYLPHDLDHQFFTAFSLYQEKINPSAKLVITLRPYYHITASLFNNIISGFGIKNFKVYQHTDRSFQDLITEADYYIRGTSTTLIEGLICRTPMLYITGHSDAPGLKYAENWSVLRRSDDVEGIVGGIMEMVERKEELVEACNKYASYYNHMDDGKSSERLVEDMVSKL